MKIKIMIITIVLLTTCGCMSRSLNQTSIAYSGPTISGAIDKGYQQATVSKIESLLGQKLPIPTYFPNNYQIKESYYYQEPNSNPQVTDILLLISDQSISWSGTQYTCRLALSISWNQAGLGLKMPSAEIIPSIDGRLEQNNNEYILWWESYGSPDSLGSTLELFANQQFSTDELIKVAASTPSNTPSTN